MLKSRQFAGFLYFALIIIHTELHRAKFFFHNASACIISSSGVDLDNICSMEN